MDYHWLPIFLFGFSLFLFRGSPQGVCLNNWMHINGSCYKISSDKLNWNAAKSACEAMGSELATVKSQSEQQALAPRITEFTWIGLHRVRYDSSPLIWVDGTRPSYTNFYPGQPDHYGGYEDCVHMLLREGQVKWNDISCSLNMLYICEMNGACPSDWIYLNGSCYKISSNKLNWNAAKSACEAMGAELATVKSQNEQQALAPRITEFTWIGLHRVRYDSSPLIWVDGTRPSYTNFYPGQPDHYGDYEDCVHMLLREGKVKWNDISCSLNMLYICEKNAKCQRLSSRRGVRVFPSSCLSSNQVYGSTCSFSCARGYRLSGPSSTQCGEGAAWTRQLNRVSCIDIDECSATKNGGCSHKCVNTAGSYKCECPDPEMSLSPDNRTCHVSSPSVIAAL